MRKVCQFAVWISLFGFSLVASRAQACRWLTMLPYKISYAFRMSGVAQPKQVKESVREGTDEMDEQLKQMLLEADRKGYAQRDAGADRAYIIKIKFRDGITRVIHSTVAQEHADRAKNFLTAKTADSFSKNNSPVESVTIRGGFGVEQFVGELRLRVRMTHGNYFRIQAIHLKSHLEAFEQTKDADLILDISEVIPAGGKLLSKQVLTFPGWIRDGSEYFTSWTPKPYHAF